RLLARESNSAKFFVRCRRQFVGQRSATTVQSLKAPVDRAGCFAGKLLEYDRPADGVEVRAVAGWPSPVRSDLVDHLRQVRIDFPEMSDRFSTKCARTRRFHSCQ